MIDRWTSLLSDARVPRAGDHAPTVATTEPIRTAFEADYDRVIYSTPFRRLARKTQVHPLSLNDHVRTRLTHSLEVGCVGRTLGRKLATFLKSKGHLPANRFRDDIAWIMLAACAAHDIGNPPFGHAGEFAIREWVTRHEPVVFGDQTVSAGTRADLRLFEGNAQGFRTAVRRDNERTGYLRLTYATLGAMIKYPWDSEYATANNLKKFNVFSTENELFIGMTAQLSLSYDAGKYARHPMSFLTEAADDICYRILDLEDAVEIGILDSKRVSAVYEKAIGVASGSSNLAVLRGKAIGELIEGMWDVFERDYDDIMSGARRDDLKKDLDPKLKEVMDEIKVIYDEIFAERSKVATELGAYKALGRIINALCMAIKGLCAAESFEDASFLTKRAMQLAWDKEYATANQRQPYEWWLHQVMDYVSGLTDNYARQLSREIEGT